MFVSRKTLSVVLLAALTLFVVSCDSTKTPVEPTPAVPPVFRQVTTLPTVTTWEKVWGTSASDLFLMGENGYVYRSDGLSWTKELSTVLSDRTILSAWGASPDSVYFVGRIADVEHTLMDTVADTPYSAYWDEPILEHYNGTTFSAVELTGVKWGLYDIWGSDSDSIFAVGYNGTILQYTGATWSIMATGGTSPVWLNSVWGSSNSNVFASGSKGSLLRYDGTSWNVIPTHTGEDLWDVWGLSDTSVYQAGTKGRVLRYDGTSISPMTTPIANTLYSIWGSSANDLWAVGWGGKLLQYKNSTWAEVDSRTRFGLLSLWGTSANNIYAAGEIVLHYDGVDWSPVTIRSEPNFADVWAGTNTSVTEVVTIGSGGTILLSSGGSTFSSMTSTGSITANLNGVAGADGRALFIVGDDGVTLQRDGITSNWLPMTSGVSTNLNSVACLSDEFAVAAGDGGVVLQFDGTDWTQQASLTAENLNDVAIFALEGDTSIWIVGDAGTTLYHDHTGWHVVTVTPSDNLRSVSAASVTQAFAAGDNGRGISFEGMSWTNESTRTSENLNGVWSLLTDNGVDLFVSGAGGLVMTRRSGVWSDLDTGIGFGLNGIFGLSATNIFLVGDYNHILRYSP